MGAFGVINFHWIPIPASLWNIQLFSDKVLNIPFAPNDSYKKAMW